MQNRSSPDLFLLRLPSGLRSAIKAMASKNERSMNSEIVFHMRAAIAGALENDRDRQGGNPDGL